MVLPRLTMAAAAAAVPLVLLQYLASGVFEAQAGGGGGEHNRWADAFQTVVPILCVELATMFLVLYVMGVVSDEQAGSLSHRAVGVLIATFCASVVVGMLFGIAFWLIVFVVGFVPAIIATPAFMRPKVGRTIAP
jgi:hypothetical protein